MIALDSSTRKLQAFLSAAATTTNPTVSVMYHDVPKVSGADYSFPEPPAVPQFTVLAGVTETDVCAAPNQGVVRHIDAISVYNADTVDAVVTVCIDDNGTNRILIKQSLSSFDTLQYEDSRGWEVVPGTLGTFIQSGTGAVERTAQDKMRDIISVKDFGAVGDGTNDDTAEIQACFNAFSSGTTGVGVGGSATPPTIYFPSGSYKISSTIQFPNAIRIAGAGKWNSRIIAASGFTGIMVQDKGNGSKVQFSDLEIDANDETGVTSLLEIGTTTSPFGTEGYIQNMLLRGGTSAVNTGTVGLKIKGNVYAVTDISCLYCDTGIEEAAASVVGRYDNIIIGFPATYGMKINQDAHIGWLYIEAPAAACVPVEVGKSCHIDSYVLSQGANITNSSAVSILSGASLGGFSIDRFENFQASGAVLTAIISDARSGLPSVWGDDGARPAKATNLCDTFHISTVKMFKLQQREVHTRLRIVNTAGTIQHRFTSPNNTGNSGSWTQGITGAQVALSNTPSISGAVDFTAGGGIVAATTSIFCLNTATHGTPNDNFLMANVVRNTTGQHLTIDVALTSRDVNGTTRTRPELQFLDATTGATFALTTANIAAGEIIDVYIDGVIKV